MHANAGRVVGTTNSAVLLDRGKATEMRTCTYLCIAHACAGRRGLGANKSSELTRGNTHGVRRVVRWKCTVGSRKPDRLPRGVGAGKLSTMPYGMAMVFICTVQVAAYSVGYFSRDD